MFAGVLPFKPNVYFLNHFNFQIVTFCLSPKFADSKTNMKEKKKYLCQIHCQITLIAASTCKHKYLLSIFYHIISQRNINPSYLGEKFNMCINLLQLKKIQFSKLLCSCSSWGATWRYIILGEWDFLIRSSPPT